MKFHFCTFNWSRWSLPVIGYSSNKVQYRRCEICEKVDFRTMRYDNQISVDKIIEALWNTRHEITFKDRI